MPLRHHLDTSDNSEFQDKDLQGAADGRFFYTLEMRGPGERIRIIAINRVTGYTGSITTELKAHSNTDTDDNGETFDRNAMAIDYSVKDIIMRPPNLKIWAERSYTVEQGLTRGTQYLTGDARDSSDDSQK